MLKMVLLAFAFMCVSWSALAHDEANQPWIALFIYNDTWSQTFGGWFASMDECEARKAEALAAAEKSRKRGMKPIAAFCMRTR